MDNPHEMKHPPHRPDDEHFMRLALERCAQGVAQGQSPFGACIVRAGEPIATDHNHVWRTTDPTAHAEIVAIRHACARLNAIHLEGATLYSTTEPCPMCFSAIHWARIERIVYAAAIEDAKSFGFNELPISNAAMKSLSGSSIELVSDVLRDDALTLYRRWAEKRSTAY